MKKIRRVGDIQDHQIRDMVLWDLRDYAVCVCGCKNISHAAGTDDREWGGVGLGSCGECRCKSFRPERLDMTVWFFFRSMGNLVGHYIREQRAKQNEG